MSVCIFYNSFPWGTLFPVSLLRLHSFPSLSPLPSASILWSLELQMAFICSYLWFIRRKAWQIRLLVLFYVPPPISCLTQESSALDAMFVSVCSFLLWTYHVCAVFRDSGNRGFFPVVSLLKLL